MMMSELIQNLVDKLQKNEGGLSYKQIDIINKWGLELIDEVYKKIDEFRDMTYSVIERTR